MPRGVPPERVSDVATAGMQVLGRLGYRRTKMAEVAALAGLSAGAIYTYVESKEALLHLVFANFFGEYECGPPSLPLEAPPFADTLAVIFRGLRREAAVPVLRAALKRAGTSDARGELAQIVDEHYSLVERVWPILAVIEKCSVDLPDLYEFYFERGRRGQLDLFARYVQSRSSSGHFDASGDAALAAQLAIESVTWFAWHRLEGFDASRFANDGARRTVVDFVCNALVPRP